MKVSAILHEWYSLNKRKLPWRESVSPYHIWLSEIIMQQTRVSQGLEYYLKFIRKYPSITDLANAPMDEVLKLWQGLGYYTRARNLQSAAITVVNLYGGVFPDTYEELLKLKGIGAYTAAAIASIAFKKPVALVDGNVSRVISRLFAIELPVDSVAGKTLIMQHATDILDIQHPDIHNQAIMEFGALVCLPRNPQCSTCVLSSFCKARLQGITNQLPVKKEKVKVRLRYFNYFFIRFQDTTYLRKRTGTDIWHSLYEFPMIETCSESTIQEMMTGNHGDKFIAALEPLEILHNVTYRHKLTHQTLICSFNKIEPPSVPDVSLSDYFPVKLDQISNYAVPRVIDRYIKELLHEGSQ